jgi:hypothetical protein
MGFYAHCLWVPLNGWDPQHKLADAWGASALGHVAQPVSNAISALAIPDNQCGPLVPVTNSVLTNRFSLDTCTWNALPAFGQFRAALTWIIPLGFGMWAVGFLIQLIAGIINRNTPSPLEEKK